MRRGKKELEKAGGRILRPLALLFLASRRVAGIGG